MLDDFAGAARSAPRPPATPSLMRLALTPLPLVLLNPLLAHVARAVAREHPTLFGRLDDAAGKRFAIDIEEFPFVLLLSPNPRAIGFEAVRREENPAHDARIAGTLLDMLDTIDGSNDSDALFFSRALHVTGDTEAAVRLRNAIDDLDGNILDTALNALGPFSAPASAAVAALRRWAAPRPR